jgi:hypothetical protein
VVPRFSSVAGAPISSPGTLDVFWLTLDTRHDVVVHPNGNTLRQRRGEKPRSVPVTDLSSPNCPSPNCPSPNCPGWVRTGSRIAGGCKGALSRLPAVYGFSGLARASQERPTFSVSNRQDDHAVVLLLEGNEVGETPQDGTPYGTRRRDTRPP